MVIESQASAVFPTAGLTPAEVGYLAEGAPRAIGASLTALAQMGLIEFRAGGKVVDVKGARGSPMDPIQQSVFDVVSRAERPSSVEDIRSAAEPATEPNRDRLRGLGLLLGERALLSWRVGISSAALTAALLLILNGAPPFQSLLLAVNLLAIVLVIFESRQGRTLHGDAALRQLRDEHVALRTSAEHAPTLLKPNELARAVAIYGPAILEEGPLSLVGKSLKREKGSCGACGGCGGCGGCGCG